MSAVAQSLMTVDEFLASAEEREGRWEIENRVAYAMAPEQLGHSDTKFATVVALRAAIGGAKAPCRAVLDGPAVRTAYQPDALVYCGPRLPPDVRERPDLIVVVEVTSPSARARRRQQADRLFLAAEHRALPAALSRGSRPRASQARRRRPDRDAHPHAGPLRLDPPGLDLNVEDLFAEA
jgi:Uma2 family endonuclease